MIIDLTKHIKVIRPADKAIFPYSNSIYIDDNVQTIIDAGAGMRAYAEIPASGVNLLLLSHSHFDHNNCLSLFTNAQVFAGREEADAYRNETAYLSYTGFQNWGKIMDCKQPTNLTKYYQVPKDIPVAFGFQPLQLAGLLKDGDQFELGHTTIRSIHTPGHSPGHYSFYFEKEGILFSGDIDGAPRGPWYGGQFSDFDQFIDSVYKMIEIKPRILVTSHRKVFYKDIEKVLRDFIDIGIKKEDNILQYLSSPHTVNDIAMQDFAYETVERNPYVEFWAKMMIMKHLHRLQRLGLVRKSEDKKYVRN